MEKESSSFDAPRPPVMGIDSCAGRYRSVQMMKELQRELAAVKENLDIISVSLQSTNGTFLRLSDIIAISTMNNGDSHGPKNSNMSSNNSKNRDSNNKNDGDDNSSDDSSSSGDESSEDSESNDSSGNSREKRKRRRRKKKSNNRNNTDSNSNDNNSKQTKTRLKINSSNSKNSNSTGNSNKSSRESDGNSNEICGGNSKRRGRSRRQMGRQSSSSKISVKSSDESSGESDGSSSGNKRRRKGRRRRQMSRINSSTDNSNKQTDTHLQDLNKKIKDLENQIQSLKAMSHTADLQEVTSYEQQLQERKKNNLVVFGLQEDQRDVSQLRALLSSLGADIDVVNTQFFWTGRSLEKPRPLIVKLRNQEEKAEILFKAKRLKNNQDWPGVSITHDLTKQQCHAEKVEEMELKRKAEERNCNLLEDEKSAKVWKVVGGRGTRRLVLRDREIRQNHSCV